MNIARLPLPPLSALLCLSFAAGAFAQQPGPRGAAWPDALVLQNGAPVRDRATFEQKRRPQIVQLLEENLYGKTPMQAIPLRVTATETDEPALGGLARRSQLTIAVGPHGERTWHLLLYLPAAASGPVPVIVGLNFNGNQTVSADAGIALNPVWVPDPALAHAPLAKELTGHILRMPDAATRGSAASQWQVEKLLRRGYGLATVYAGEIEPDFNGGMDYGVRPLFFEPGQKQPKPGEWGAIGAWAWGMSRVVDVLSANPKVDAHRMIAFGFSRFGKTALWAAAQDSRFVLMLSNESGKGGASLLHHQKGETSEHLMQAFPYWFCANFQQYLGRVQELPLDGHLLLSLIAPRPLYVGSALEDPYSDYEGEYLSTQAVSGVYALYQKTGVPGGPVPALDRSVGDTVSYHVRRGGHDVTEFDWEQYLDFADRQLAHPKK
jgi:hypothetical protein